MICGENEYVSDMYDNIINTDVSDMKFYTIGGKYLTNRALLSSPCILVNAMLRRQNR